MLKILFVTQSDPFYIPEFFREFIAHWDPLQIDVRGVIIQSPLGKKSRRELVRQMLAFYGPGNFFRLGVTYAVKKALAFVVVGATRGRFPGTFSLEHLLLKSGWPIIRNGNINAPEFTSRLKEMNLDLIVSVAASQKFKAEVLAVPRFGCINVHNSPLPKNRGMLPNFWALCNIDQEPVSGMTVHKMNATLDDGPIVLQHDVLLSPRESLHDLILRTKRLNAHLVLEALALYRGGEPIYLPNDAGQATYNNFPTREDVRVFKAKGLRLL